MTAGDFGDMIILELEGKGSWPVSEQMRYLVRVGQAFAFDFAADGRTLPFFGSVMKHIV